MGTLDQLDLRATFSTVQAPITPQPNRAGANTKLDDVDISITGYTEQTPLSLLLLLLRLCEQTEVSRDVVTIGPGGVP